MSVQANIIRIEIETGDPYRSPASKISGGIIYLPRSRDIALQLGVYENGIFVPSPTYLATITAEVRPFANRGGPALVTATTSTVNQITESEWQLNTGQHATVTLPAAQTAGLSPAVNETDYWLVITALTTGGNPLTLLAGRVIGVDDGGNYSATVPTPGDPTFVTASQYYSTIVPVQAGEFTYNGWRVRMDVDANGLVSFNATPA